MMMSRSVAVAVALLAAWSTSARADDARTGSSPPNPDFVAKFGDKAMGTIVNLTMWTDDEMKAAEAAKAVFAEFRRIDALMTTWGNDSDVARINAAAGKAPVKVSEETLAVIERSLEVSRQSGGAFDITVGGFKGVWKFDDDLDGTVPEDAQVQARRKLVNYRWVEVNHRKRTVKLRKKGMQITLGGIAKGYAVDRGLAILHERGLADFILQAGGDLYVSGRRGNRAWRVGIRDPRGSRDATFALAEIQDMTFSTAGDYERGFVKDGVRYHHIIDPSTGYPAKLSRSVTVMAKDALTADAWDTTLLILGHEKGMKLVEKMPDLEAVFVDAGNQVHISTGLQKTLRIQKKPTDGP